MRIIPGASSPRRRGYGLIELAISSLLLAATVALVAQAAGSVAAERRGAERRQVAVQEAANQMERLSARPWDDLAPESVKSLRLSDPAKAALRDGVLAVVIAPTPDDPTARKITIEIRWRDRAGGREAPVRLVAWVHKRGGPKP